MQESTPATPDQAAAEAAATAVEPAAAPRMPEGAPVRPSGWEQWLFEGRGYALVKLVADLVLLAVSVRAAQLFTDERDPVVTLAFIPLVILLLAWRRMYDPRAQIGSIDRVAIVLGTVALVGVSVAGLVALVDPERLDSKLEIGELVVAGGLLVAFRGAFAMARSRSRRRRHSGRPTLIVGAGDMGTLLERRLAELPELGMIPVGFIDPDPVPDADPPERGGAVLGSLGDLERVVEETGAQHVVLAFFHGPDLRLRPLVRRCEAQGVAVSLVPRLFDETTDRIVLEHVGGVPVFALRQIDPKGWQFGIKDVFDRTGAALGLILAAPIMAGTALAVRLSSRGPILFRQPRIGRDGREFDLLKFRSMRPEASGTTSPKIPAGSGEVAPGGVEAKDRVTGVGRFIRRFSIDELPQIFNVLKGDMSVVGPRPERPEYVELFDQLVDRYEDRHRVKSGITGWAQVNGLRGNVPLRDRVEWDNWYIQNWSLWLDFKILLLTAPAVLRGAD